jgi:hypothetical protein
VAGCARFSHFQTGLYCAAVLGEGGDRPSISWCINALRCNSLRLDLTQEQFPNMRTMQQIARLPKPGRVVSGRAGTLAHALVRVLMRRWCVDTGVKREGVIWLWLHSWSVQAFAVETRPLRGGHMLGLRLVSCACVNPFYRKGLLHCLACWKRPQGAVARNQALGGRGPLLVVFFQWHVPNALGVCPSCVSLFW